MSTTFNYEFNLGNAASPTVAPRRVDPDAPLYASEDGVVASLSSSECIFQARRTGASHVMTYQVLQALDQCREFRTLDEHIARIQTSVSGLSGKQADVQRVLGHLVSLELLVSDRQFLDRVAAAPVVEPASLGPVFIRACNRPAQLQRLLRSLADYERSFRAGRHYVLLDDSTEASAIERHRDLLRDFASATGCRLSLLDGRAQQKLLDRLRRAVPQAAGALPGLLMRQDGQTRFGGGRSWNLALLLSAGQRLVLFDDDQFLPLRQLESARSGLNPDPAARASVHFHASLDEAGAAGQELSADPFEVHLAACGHALGTLSRDASYAIDRQSLHGQNLGRLAHLEAPARVIATAQGAVGSSRTENSNWLYQLDDASREAFWRSREEYLYNMDGLSLWYGYDQARASGISAFTPFMLDNSMLLPCTNASGRGEDLLFATVANLLHPAAVTLELPMAIGHVQESARGRGALSLEARTPRFNHFVADFIQRQVPAPLAEDPVQRLALLGTALRDAAGASSRMRTQHLREYLSFTRADLIERLQQQFESSSDAPVYWQADVRGIIEANGRALLANAAPRLGDWSEDSNEEACATLLQQELSALADGYDAWPALWHYAHEQGERLLAGL